MWLGSNQVQQPSELDTVKIGRSLKKLVLDLDGVSHVSFKVQDHPSKVVDKNTQILFNIIILPKSMLYYLCTEFDSDLQNLDLNTTH